MHQPPGKAHGREQADPPSRRSRAGRRTGTDVDMRHQTRDAQRMTRHIEQHMIPRPENDVGQQDRPITPVIEALRAVTKLASVVEWWRTRLARLARCRGAKWSEIGHALGVSRQAAHERYRH